SGRVNREIREPRAHDGAADPRSQRQAYLGGKLQPRLQRRTSTAIGTIPGHRERNQSCRFTQLSANRSQRRSPRRLPTRPVFLVKEQHGSQSRTFSKGNSGPAKLRSCLEWFM